MKKTKNKIAVIALDIKNFKSINESHGHKKGDELIVDFIKRIDFVKGYKTTASRLGGDEFLILLENVKNLEYIKGFIDRLLEKLKEPFIINNTEVYIQIWIGVTKPKDPTIDPELLIKQADTALHEAKIKNSNTFILFSKEMHQSAIKRYNLERNLRKALHESELDVYYQPQLELQKMKVLGCEALIRWKTEQGFIPPNEFIPLAEKSNLILEITEFLLKKVCKDLETIKKLGFVDFYVSINLSATHFDNENNITSIIKIVEKSTIDFKHLIFEITESSFIKNSDRTISMLTKLREKGARIALDDFGTGYSSLSYLQKYPIDIIKIDKTFVDYVPESKQAVAMLKAIVDMGLGLGLNVIAEGTEKQNQVDFVKDIGCNFIQGFWFSPAVTKQELLSVLQASSRACT